MNSDDDDVYILMTSKLEYGKRSEASSGAPLEGWNFLQKQLATLM